MRDRTMKRLLTLSLLLVASNGCAEVIVMVYEGNNFEECKAIASIITNNDSDYNKSMKTCNSLLPQAQHRQSLRPQSRGIDNVDNDARLHGEQTKGVNRPSCRPPNC
jgi:hypothetical protein